MCLIPFVIVLILSIGASLFASSKESDFFLAGRSVRWPLLLGTFVGTQIGGGFILGNTDASWSIGPMGSLYGIGLALGMLGLGLGFAARLRKMNLGTIPELLGRKFRSPLLTRTAAVLSIVSLGGILMCQAIGLQKFLCSMGFNNPWIFIASWAVVVLYTSFGGLLAVIWTDLIQATIMILMLGITFVFALLPQWDIISTQASSMSCPLQGSVLSSLIIPFCFIFVGQDMAQRCFAAKTPKDATIASVATAVVLVVLSAIPTMCGILGRALSLSPSNGAIFIQVMNAVANPLVFITAASAVLLAIISTASAILLALSSNVAKDMKIGERQSRWMTLILGVLALLGPFLSSDIISWMVGSYEVSVSALFVPLLYAVYSKNETLPKSSAWAAAILGAIGLFISKFLPNEPLSIALPFMLSAVGLLVGKQQVRQKVFAN